MDKLQLRILWLLLSVLFVLYSFYAVWSYSLTDPNLVFTSWQPYWQAQQWLWQSIYANAQLQSALYVVLLLGIWVVYGLIVHQLASHFRSVLMQPKHWLVILAVATPLVISYNALSHDIFNYIFNARMIIQYGADPHVQTALKFVSDPWVRFMHNTHTVAPYGYGWTAITIIPYLLGFGKFTVTWILFKLSAALSLLLLAASTNWLSVQVRKQPLSWPEVGLLFLNPLLLIEVLGNAHNDLWMMAPALVAVGIALRFGTKKLGWLFGLILTSVSVKYATLVLLPAFILILYAENIWERLRSRLLLRLPMQLLVPLIERLIGDRVRKNIVGITATAAAILLLLPLLTSRSQQFHPWYLLWSLVWLPFISVRFVKVLLVSFSISSLFRYVPWIYTGGFAGETVSQQQLVTLVGGMVGMLLWFAWSSVRMRSKRSII